MAVNKNFVVKNGLEVNTNLIVADAEIGRVGIATTTITSDFHVVGGIGVTDLLVTGIATINNLRVSAGATFLGIATFQGPNVHIDNDLFVGGIQIIDSGDGTTIGTDVNIKNNLKVIGGITTIAVGPLIVGSAASTGTDGQIFQVSGITSNAYIGGQLGIGTTNPNANHALHVLGNTRLAGVTTFTGISSFLTNVNIAGDLHVDGDIQYDEITGRNLNISGIATFQNLTAGRIPFVGTGSTLKDNPNLQFKTDGTQLIVGVGATIGSGLTAASVMVEDLTNDRVVIAGTNGELEDDANFTFNGTQLVVGVGASVGSGFTAQSITPEGLTDNRVVLVGSGSTLEDDGNLTFNGQQLVIGVGASVGSGFTAQSITPEGLTDNRVVLVGSGSTLEDDANFTFNGTELFVGTAATFTSSFNVGGDVGIGTTNPTSATITAHLNDNTKVLAAGVGTFGKVFSNGLELVDGGSITLDGLTQNRIPIVGASSTIKDNNNLRFVDNGLTQLIVGVGASVGSGLTAQSITPEGLTDNRVVIVGSGSTLEDDANFTFNGTSLFVGVGATITGILTAGSFRIGNDEVISAAKQLKNIASLDSTTTATIESAISAAPNNFNDLNIAGIATISGLHQNGIVHVGIGSTLRTQTDFTFSGTQLAVGGGVTVGSGLTASTVMVEDLTNNRVVIAGTDGELEDDANFTFDGSTLGVTGDFTLTDTDDGSAAGPELKLYRNSASPADADYLGQIKFAGESDTGVERNYAKITGKIDDASNGTEDGIIEIAHIKAGSQNISARFKSTELQLLNDTDFSVAGDSTFTGDVSIADKIIHTGDTNTAIRFPAADTFTVETSGNERLRVTSGGDVGIGTTNPTSATINTALDNNTNVLAVGIVTANQYFGDGSNLENVGAELVVQNDGTNVSTAVTTINFSTSVTATASGGIATVTASGGGASEVDTTVQTTSATGVGSFSITSHRSAAVIAQINQGQGNCQVGRYLMIHDGVAGAATTTVTVVEESAVSTGSTMLGSFTARVHAGNAELMVNMGTSGIATVTTKIDSVTV